MIEVTNEIKVYENKGKPEEKLKIYIGSHWNDDKMVNIILPGFNALTVLAKDLKAAIDNATNSARF
jgi:hypothetical protein